MEVKDLYNQNVKIMKKNGENQKMERPTIIRYQN